MKKLVLIGASGFVGASLLHEAIERGYSVKAIVRHPEKVSVSNPNLELVKVDIMDTEGLAAQLAGADAVISAYNPGWTNPDIAVDTDRGYKSIIKAVKQAGIKRLQVVGGAGSLFVAPGKTVVDSGAIPDAILPGVLALAKVLKEDLTSEKDLDWVFFSPAGTIAPGERTGKYRLGKDDLIVDGHGESKISVEDYAKAMIDELEKPQHHQERFTIGY